MFLDLFLELCQLIAMKLQDFINKSEWQGPVKVNQVTEEMLQKNPDWSTWGTLSGDLYLYNNTGLELWIREESDGDYSLVGGE